MILNDFGRSWGGLGREFCTNEWISRGIDEVLSENKTRAVATVSRATLLLSRVSKGQHGGNRCISAVHYAGWEGG